MATTVRLTVQFANSVFIFRVAVTVDSSWQMA